MHVFLVILSFSLIVLCEIPGIIKNKEWKTLAVFVALIATGLTLALLQTITGSAPNPVKSIAFLVERLKSLFH